MRFFAGKGTGSRRRLVSGGLWTAMAIAAIIGSVMLMHPNVALSSSGSSGDMIHLLTGVGQKVFIEAATNNAKTGDKSCTPGMPVEVLMTIGGGKPGNSVHVEATCGGVVVASGTAYDSGLGFTMGTFGAGVQIAGDGECHITTGGGQPQSEWIAKCHFYTNPL